MYAAKSWSKNFKKNWKIYLVILLMVLTLVARGAGSLTRSGGQTTPLPPSTAANGTN